MGRQKKRPNVLGANEPVGAQRKRRIRKKKKERSTCTRAVQKDREICGGRLRNGKGDDLLRESQRRKEGGFRVSSMDKEMAAYGARDHIFTRPELRTARKGNAEKEERQTGGNWKGEIFEEGPLTAEGTGGS